MVYRESVTCSVEGGIWPSVMTLISARGDKDRRGYSPRKGEFDDNAIYSHKDAGFIRWAFLFLYIKCKYNLILRPYQQQLGSPFQHKFCSHKTETWLLGLHRSHFLNTSSLKYYTCNLHKWNERPYHLLILVNHQINSAECRKKWLQCNGKNWLLKSHTYIKWDK